MATFQRLAQLYLALCELEMNAEATRVAGKIERKASFQADTKVFCDAVLPWIKRALPLVRPRRSSNAAEYEGFRQAACAILNAYVTLAYKPEPVKPSSWKCTKLGCGCNGCNILDRCRNAAPLLEQHYKAQRSVNKYHSERLLQHCHARAG